MSTTALDLLLAQRTQFVAFVRHRVSDRELAEDIVQTAYLQAVRFQKDFKSGESVVAWFYRLLRNAVVDSYRRRTSRNRALEAWARELDNAAQPPHDLNDEICACLYPVLDALKPEYSEILRAVDLGEQRIQDFAVEHKLSVSNAGVRVHRARAAFRKGLLKACTACTEHGCLNCTCKKSSKIDQSDEVQKKLG